MATILLIVIYFAFISLGLPDALLGAAWPAMRAQLGLPLDAAGMLTMVITGGTVISSLTSERLVGRFGASRVTAVSVLATAVAMFGFVVSPNLPLLVLCCVPLGLGAGAVDAALNNYVALHYQPRHMSWLHCFWGVGAFMGPTLLSVFMGQNGNWRGGYLLIGGIQAVLVVMLFAVQPLWRRQEAQSNKEKAGAPAAETPEAAGAPTPAPAAAGIPEGKKSALAIPGVVYAMLAFFCYCAVEYCANLWSSSYFVEARGMTEALAAQGTALYFVGITVGRLVTGFLTIRFSSETLIRVGSLTILAGGLLMLVAPGGVLSIAALAIIGLGCAPVYPCMIQETPVRFGAGVSQKIIGWQMATAYTGNLLVPPAFGMLAQRVGIGIYPWVFLLIGAALLLCTELVARKVYGKGGKPKAKTA